MRPLHLEPWLAQRHVDVLGLDVVEAAATLATEVMVRRDVGVELSGSGPLDHAEQPGLGQLTKRVVDGCPRQLRKLGPRPLEHLLGAQVTVLGAGEQPVDRAPLCGGAEAVGAQQLSQRHIGERGGGGVH